MRWRISHKSAGKHLRKQRTYTCVDSTQGLRTYSGESNVNGVLIHTHTHRMISRYTYTKRSPHCITEHATHSHVRAVEQILPT